MRKKKISRKNKKEAIKIVEYCKNPHIDESEITDWIASILQTSEERAERARYFKRLHEEMMDKYNSLRKEKILVKKKEGWP